MNSRLIYGVVLLLLGITSCIKEVDDTVVTSNKGVYISNEGGFNFGAAEVSFYDPTTNKIDNGLFKKANNYMLGDVAQSIYIKDSLAFIMVNNSQKIEVVNVATFKSIRTITIPGSSPRYFMPVNDSIAYVTELYAATIYVINYATGTVVKNIGSVSRWTEHMLNFGDYVLVEERNLDAYPSSTSGLVKINASTHSFVQRYPFDGANLNGMVKDKNAHIWIATDEDTIHSIPSKLLCLNTDMSINKTIVFAKGHHPTNLCINGAGDILYFFDDNLMRMSIDEVSVPGTPFIERDGRNLYALGVDPVTEDIYVSDALDYIQSSRIYRYDKDGNEVHSFTAGVISGNFTFRYE